MGIPEGEEKEKGTDKVFEAIMTENFPKLMSDTKPYIQEAQGKPSRIYAKKTTSRHIIFKLQKTKDKEKILKEAR